MIPYRQRRLEPLVQRLGRLRALLRGGLAKRQAVHLVEIGGLRAKRVSFAHASQAAAVERALEALRGRGVAPEPLARYGGELWVEFVEGAALGRDGPAPVGELGRLFRTLYRVGAAVLAREDRDFARDVVRDLDLLRRVGVIDAETHARLERHAESSCPTRAWTGCDYVDARPRNFLRGADGRLVVIDVESLVAGELLGTGAARAWLRWPGVGREALLAELSAPDLPRVADYADFLELRFAARWTKRCLLQRKLSLVDPELLRRLAARG